MAINEPRSFHYRDDGDEQDTYGAPSANSELSPGSKAAKARHVMASEVGNSDLALDAFFNEHPLDVRHIETVKYNLPKGPSRVADFLCRLIGGDLRRIPGYQSIYVHGLYGNSPVFVLITWRESGDIIATKTRIEGTRDICKALAAKIEEAFTSEHEPMAKWWYRGDHGVTERKVVVPRVNLDIKPELYPDLTDPKAYIRRYLDSDASILLMAGLPGTGKTTLLRYLICHHRLYAHLVYDEQLMKSDSLFQSFLFDANSDILVIEDADTILSSREDDQNKLMSRFLNVSDGLIKLPNKKVVFTTNINDFGKVDPALLRPGRCFDVLHTRPLNLAEAQAAANACNLPVPTQKGEFTLAELFNRNQGGKTRQMGFAAQ